MVIVFGIIVVILTFGFMIFVHELGHFLMAKRVGIRVHEFALGFGPRLFRYKKEGDETEYCLRSIPFGGFVRMEGEDEPGDPDDPGNFNNKTVWERAKVIVAGCAMNYITGISLLLLVGFIWGIGIMIPPAKVDVITENYPLAKTEVKSGDTILAVDGQEVKNFKDLKEIIKVKKEGEKVTLLVEREGKSPFTVTVPVKFNKEYGEGMLGFSPPANKLLGFQFIRVPAKDVFLYTGQKTVLLTFSPVILVQRLITKEMTPAEVGKGTAGPLGIGQMIFEISKMGIAPIFYMCAILSILIGAFNLIPFPALDGSRLLFLIVEWVRRRPIDPDKEGFIHQLGFIVLIILVLVVTYNDILRLFQGKSFFK